MTDCSIESTCARAAKFLRDPLGGALGLAHSQCTLPCSGAHKALLFFVCGQLTMMVSMGSTSLLWPLFSNTLLQVQRSGWGLLDYLLSNAIVAFTSIFVASLLLYMVAVGRAAR